MVVRVRICSQFTQKEETDCDSDYLYPVYCWMLTNFNLTKDSLSYMFGNTRLHISGWFSFHQTDMSDER